MASGRPNMDLSLDDMIKANRHQDRRRPAMSSRRREPSPPSCPPLSPPPSSRQDREARRPRHSSHQGSRYFDSQSPDHHHRRSLHPRRPRGKLVITNLHYDVTREDLKSLFETIGPVSKVFMHYDRAGRSNGVAEVSFEQSEDARVAQERFHNVPLDGLPMQIEMRTAPLRSEYDMALD